AMKAQAATSIQKSAMPSKRAEIQATASALGGNHANAKPAVSAAVRAPRVAGPASCHDSNATSAASAAWSVTLTSRHAAASAPLNTPLAAKDAITSGRYWFDGGPTPEMNVFQIRAATSCASTQ